MLKEVVRDMHVCYLNLSPFAILVLLLSVESDICTPCTLHPLLQPCEGPWGLSEHRESILKLIMYVSPRLPNIFVCIVLISDGKTISGAKPQLHGTFDILFSSAGITSSAAITFTLRMYLHYCRMNLRKIHRSTYIHVKSARGH